MNTGVRACAVFLVIAMVLPLTAAENAGVLYKRAREEEARQDYEAAFEHYRQAWFLKPDEIAYQAATNRTRFLAAAAKVHRGIALREAGQWREALQQFQAAVKIDPSTSIARQEIERTLRAAESAKSTPSARSVEADPRLQELREIEGPVKLAPISSTPITLNLSEDSKVIYQTIGRLAGINVLFDPDYTSRRLHVELNAVTLQQSLEMVAMESRTFWRPVSPNTIFVAGDNPAKRKELDQNVIKTFYLSNLTTPSELQDIVNTMRTILEVNKIQPLASREAVVVRGTPDQILLAEKLIRDFDTPDPEVVIDLTVMQVSRDKLHNLGISPPTSASVQLQDNTSSSDSSSTTSSTNTINLNRLGNLNATDFTATISSASANALASDSATKILQNPRLRSINGQKASLKIGDRVPTATGSYSSGVGTATVSALVNTQFTYLDVGVNLDITPHVHAGGEITLKIILEVSSVTSYVTIGGISEPVIGQRKVEHEIRLKDGEVNLLGGMLEHQDTKSISGIPGLSQIPILKYLFSETSTEVKDNEIVFALVPHIVRNAEASELSQKTVDVGTAGNIHLRRTSGGDLESAKESGASATAIPTAKLPGDTVPALEFSPSAITAKAGAAFVVDIRLSGARDISAVPLRVAYDTTKLQLVNCSHGDFLAQDDQVVALVHNENPSAGFVDITASRPSGAAGANGQGIVTSLTFLAKSSGLSTMKITGASLTQSGGQSAAVSGAEMTVNVQ